jgi:serine/threonine-protein kinase
MAYEQALNANLVDGRSDIFALGATLYHLLTGKVPFPGATHEEVVQGKEQETFSPIRELNPEVPPCLADIIGATLARDPRARVQSAAALADALEATGLATRIPAYPASDESAGPGSEADGATRADLKVPERTAPIPPLTPTEGFNPAPRIRPTAAPGIVSPHSFMRVRIVALLIAAAAAIAAGAVLSGRSSFSPHPAHEPKIVTQEAPQQSPTSDSVATPGL